MRSKAMLVWMQGRVVTSTFPGFWLETNFNSIGHLLSVDIPGSGHLFLNSMGVVTPLQHGKIELTYLLSE